MNQISLYLSKYKHLGLEEKLVKEKVLEVLNNEFNFEVESNQISFRNSNLRINITGPQKTEIVLNKEKITEALNKELEKVNSKVNKLN
jgi:hypothetical protein